MKTIGEKFKSLRKQSTFNQQQIADFLHFNQSMISKIENDERTLSVNELERVANLCGYGLDYFTDEEKPEALKVSFRTKGISVEDMEGIARINRIALNLKEMNKLSKGVSYDSK